MTAAELAKALALFDRVWGPPRPVLSREESIHRAIALWQADIIRAQIDAEQHAAWRRRLAEENPGAQLFYEDRGPSYQAKIERLNGYIANAVKRLDALRPQEIAA